MKKDTKTIIHGDGKRNTKLKCWEYFQCDERDCPILKSRKLTRCWLISGTHCRNEIQGKFIEKIEMCLKCKVFKANMDIPAVEKTMAVLSRQLEEYHDEMGKRDRELETANMDLSIGLSETFEALKKIASGDPSVRIPEQSNIELLRQLKYLVNLTAQEIGEIVKQSHEFAIDLAEHFDVLHRVSKGDLNARIGEKSNTEISQALKIVTNEMIENIQKAEKALRESEEKYSSLFQHSNDAIFVHDLSGAILDANEKVLDQFQYTKSEILSMNVADIYPDEALPISKKAFKKVAETGFVDFEVDFRTKDGEVFPAEVSSSLFKIGGREVIQSIVRDITDRKRAVEQIAYMAYHDSLTNLPNRHLLKDRLQQAISSAKDYNRIVAVFFLDLDNFKRINDTLGHDRGDKLLQNVADRLQGYIRNSDSIARLKAERGVTTIARLGGDEFTILLTELKHVKDAATVAQRILDLFNEPFEVESHEIFITTSIGISVYPDDGDTVDTLLKHADTAMYHAKEQAKNNYQFYKESMNITTVERLDLENKLRKALDKGEFVLYYQPQLDTRTNKITAVEALIRWIHPDKGMILPMTFIPAAEETGLIIPIGEWILRTACNQNKTWQRAGLPPIRVTVNISGVQFRQKTFVKMVNKVLEESGLDPQYLELELTETILMQTTDTAVSTVKALKSLGIRLSIDDFGTGYCSLNYLKSFPIDTLKIDQSFIRDLSINHEDKAIIQAIIALGHGLKLHVIAEGVETKQQLAYLSEKESDAVQGFLLSKPLPDDLLREFFKENVKLMNVL
jgi:diguanylate cyclase (GGDEF)-like protein/PAS domain S-box-containing protein